MLAAVAVLASLVVGLQARAHDTSTDSIDFCTWMDSEAAGACPPTQPSSKGDVTRLLEDWAKGDAEALNHLFPMVIDELHVIASASLAREGPYPSLQPTELIDEVCLKLLGQKQLHWDNRSQFYAFSSMLMRRILVDHARCRRAAKRDVVKVPFHEALGVPDEALPDILAVDEALKDLEAIDPRQAQIVNMRIFGGWTIDEVAEAMGIGTMTVKRDWGAARLWIRRELSRG